MTDLYLILHKVRGEPAFDIACKLQIGDEEGWIIPTSGHRAYPVRHWELASLADIDDINYRGEHTKPYYQDEIPDDWPDHYSHTREPTISDAKLAQALLDSLGITPRPKQRFIRR